MLHLSDSNNLFITELITSNNLLIHCYIYTKDTGMQLITSNTLLIHCYIYTKDTGIQLITSNTLLIHCYAHTKDIGMQWKSVRDWVACRNKYFPVFLTDIRVAVLRENESGGHLELAYME